MEKRYAKIFTSMNADIDNKKMGVTYNSLPKSFQDHINEHLKPTSYFAESITTGAKVSVEWITKLGSTKLKILTRFDGINVIYDVKNRNKYLVKGGTKLQAATKVAQMYATELKRNR